MVQPIVELSAIFLEARPRPISSVVRFPVDIGIFVDNVAQIG